MGSQWTQHQSKASSEVSYTKWAMQGGRYVGEKHLVFKTIFCILMYSAYACTDTVGEICQVLYVRRIRVQLEYAACSVRMEEKFDIHTLHVHLYSKWTHTDNPSDDVYTNNCW